MAVDLSNITGTRLPPQRTPGLEHRPCPLRLDRFGRSLDE